MRRGGDGLKRAALSGGVLVVGLVLVVMAGMSPVGATPAGAEVLPGQTPPLRMLLVGDSMAESLGNGLSQVSGGYGLVIDNQGTPNCSLATGVFQVQAYPPQESAPPCQPGSGDPGWPSDWASMVAQFDPQVSVFQARLDIMNRIFDGRWTQIGDPAYDAYLVGQMQLAVQVLSARGGKVVFLTSPYYDSGSQPDGQAWPEDDPNRVDLYNSMLRHVAEEYPGVAYVIDVNRIADPAGHFQEVIDGVPVRFTDGVHWTFQGDWWLAPRILPQIFQVGAGNGGLVIDATTLATPRTPAYPRHQPVVAIAPTRSGDGYWLSSRDGGIFAYGDSRFAGSLGGSPLNLPVVGMNATPDGGGYWMVASDGGIFAFGDARFYGSTGAMTLNQPVVGMASTPDGGGYWLVASDGGIFAFGDARFYGSTGAMTLNQPVVGMASTPDGGGYWLVASDGGIFAFGDARFYGSTGAMTLNQPVVGMASTPDGGGYWLVASDGGIFAFGDARFYGSTGAMTLNQPVVGMASTPDGGGYWLVASDGGIFAFGDARFYGSNA